MPFSLPAITTVQLPKSIRMTMEDPVRSVLHLHPMTTTAFVDLRIDLESIGDGTLFDGHEKGQTISGAAFDQVPPHLPICDGDTCCLLRGICSSKGRC